jgi:hypothetical protein
MLVLKTKEVVPETNHLQESYDEIMEKGECEEEEEASVHLLTLLIHTLIISWIIKCPPMIVQLRKNTMNYISL